MSRKARQWIAGRLAQDQNPGLGEAWSNLGSRNPVPSTSTFSKSALGILKTQATHLFCFQKISRSTPISQLFSITYWLCGFAPKPKIKLLILKGQRGSFGKNQHLFELLPLQKSERPSISSSAYHPGLSPLILTLSKKLSLCQARLQKGRGVRSTSDFCFSRRLIWSVSGGNTTG